MGYIRLMLKAKFGDDPLVFTNVIIQPKSLADMVQSQSKLIYQVKILQSGNCKFYKMGLKKLSIPN